MRASAALLGLALGTVAACGDPPPGRTFYERNIEPILVASCSQGTGFCHRVDDDDPFGMAAGNLDVSTYDNVIKRRDLLQPFGPYPVAPLLLKVTGVGTQQVAYNGEFLDLEIPHVGGANITIGSGSYLKLLSWLTNGATETGVAPPTPAAPGVGACSTALPPDFDPAPYASHPQFGTFRDDIEPIFQAKGCSSGNCHGAPQADFYITCGTDADQLAFNFSQAWSLVTSPSEDSQILQVPLATVSGGGPHTGGDQFASRDDADYVTIKEFAEQVGPIEFGVGDPGREFFADHVQPVLIKRGCHLPACHSPSAANDLKLRAGSQGYFSAIALEKNYELVRNEFMALEFPDARRGRAVAKGIVPDHGGISHRGGFVLEGGGTLPANCGVFDPATSNAFCTIQEWLRIEREPLIAAGEVLPLESGDTVPIVYVDRLATHVATPLETTYQPSSDLFVATATLGAGGAITTLGAGTSLLDNCAGAATRTTVDVRAPDVRYDGDRVVFAMRTSAADRLSIWAVDLDGSNCTRITTAAADDNGLEKHDFDPAWSPDGEWIVFASTRGGADGPTKSRKLYLAQADLWRMQASGSGLEQMTFLTNSEISPQFMREGRTTMTTEKVSDGFYQLAGRRQNWDLTDYHPLLAQRAESPYGDLEDSSVVLPSIDYAQATDIREDANGDFLVILSDAGARGGAGALGIFNRSVGPFEADRTDPGYLKSLVIVDPDATGRVGAGATSGAYRNPVGLPDGRILVSYVGFGGDLATATSLDWDLVTIDPVTGARQVLLGGTTAHVDAVLALKHPPREMYLNRRQLVFGGSLNPSLGDRAIVHIPDAPMVFTVLTGNLRRGRPVDSFRRASRLVVYRENAMAGDASEPADYYESRTMVGAVDLAGDGSVKIEVPSGVPVVLELVDDDDQTVVIMGEEHQLGPGEQITMGIREELFDAVCGGCHGSVSGQEIDVTVTPDALTGASQSLSASANPTSIGN